MSRTAASLLLLTHATACSRDPQALTKVRALGGLGDSRQTRGLLPLAFADAAERVGWACDVVQVRDVARAS